MKNEENQLTPIKVVISRFDGEYSFLSNFDEHEIAYGYFIFGSNEALYQSLKSDDIDIRAEFAMLRPGDAKKKGRSIKLREDWGWKRRQVMFNTCREKFAQNPELLEKLLATGDAELIEGNTWGDQYWGICKGEGENHLGKILMELRARFQDEEFLRESIFFASVRKQYAAAIADQMKKSKIGIVDSAYELGFYSNLLEYLVERFVDEMEFDEKTVVGVQQAFINGKMSLTYLYERYLVAGNFSDNDASLLEFLKDEVQNMELYKLQ